MKAYSIMTFKLFVLHVLVILLSNYLVQIPFESFGIQTTWGMFTFPILVLATDLTVRLSGARQARRIVNTAYFPAILISIYLADIRVGLASASAYWVGQILDIFIFQKLISRTKHWWVAPFISTTLSNITDTYLFFYLAFHNSSNAFMSENCLKIATVDLTFKIIISTTFFLPLYKGLLHIILKQHASNLKSFDKA